MKRAAEQTVASGGAQRSPEDDARLRSLPPVAALVARAREGDRSAFRALYERTAPMVHAVLLSRVQPSDADDLVQEVFLTAWRKLPSLRDGNRVGPWLVSIARNRANRLHTRGPASKRDAETLSEASAEDAALSTRDVDRDDAEKSRAALACLQELPETYREVLTMRLIEGLAGPEIARALERSADTVRVQLARGTKLLRERLATKGWS